MPAILGTVYQSGTNIPLADASVRLDKPDCPRLQLLSMANGQFRQDSVDPGEWNLSAWHEHFLPYYQKVVLDKEDAQISVHLSSQHDEAAGKKFFVTLLLILGSLLLIYILLHIFLSVKEPPISQILVATINDVYASLQRSADTQTDNALQEKVSVFSTEAKSVLETTTRLSIEDKKLAGELLDEMASAVAAGKKDAALTYLEKLKQLFLTPPSGFFEIWTGYPLRMLEILLWGLAGVLVSKIIQVGWYLRKQSYYREGMWVDIAHLVTTPLLVLITVLLLSLVTFTFTLASGNEVTIDLSDPSIMVAFAFVIATLPWVLWRFIENSAKRFTGQ
jgi:hypothetical protein